MLIIIMLIIMYKCDIMLPLKILRKYAKWVGKCEKVLNSN